MPFRLTRQFVNLMQPLKESGLIQSVMVHSLRAYSAEPDLLLNTMDVFVKEPSLDWKVTNTPARKIPLNMDFLNYQCLTGELQLKKARVFDKRSRDVSRNENF